MKKICIGLAVFITIVIIAIMSTSTGIKNASIIATSGSGDAFVYDGRTWTELIRELPPNIYLPQIERITPLERQSFLCVLRNHEVAEINYEDEQWVKNKLVSLDSSIRTIRYTSVQKDAISYLDSGVLMIYNLRNGEIRRLTEINALVNDWNDWYEWVNEHELIFQNDNSEIIKYNIQEATETIIAENASFSSLSNNKLYLFYGLKDQRNLAVVKNLNTQEEQLLTLDSQYSWGVTQVREDGKAVIAQINELAETSITTDIYLINILDAQMIPTKYPYGWADMLYYFVDTE